MWIKVVQNKQKERQASAYIFMVHAWEGNFVDIQNEEFSGTWNGELHQSETTTRMVSHLGKQIGYVEFGWLCGVSLQSP